MICIQSHDCRGYISNNGVVECHFRYFCADYFETAFHELLEFTGRDSDTEECLSKYLAIRFYLRDTLLLQLSL